MVRFRSGFFSLVLKTFGGWPILAPRVAQSWRRSNSGAFSSLPKICGPIDLSTIIRSVIYRHLTINYKTNHIAPYQLQIPEITVFDPHETAPKCTFRPQKMHFSTPKLPHSAPCQAKFLSVSSQPTHSKPHRVLSQLRESPSFFAILKVRSPEGRC